MWEKSIKDVKEAQPALADAKSDAEKDVKDLKKALEESKKA